MRGSFNTGAAANLNNWLGGQDFSRHAKNERDNIVWSGPFNLLVPRKYMSVFPYRIRNSTHSSFRDHSVDISASHSLLTVALTSPKADGTSLLSANLVAQNGSPELHVPVHAHKKAFTSVPNSPTINEEEKEKSVSNFIQPS